MPDDSNMPDRSNAPPSLHTADNGHLTLSFNDWPELSWQAFAHRLETRWGLVRSGATIIGAAERIEPDFVGAQFTLAAGYDNWSGRYLLSQSAAGDECLQTLFDSLGDGTDRSIRD